MWTPVVSEFVALVGDPNTLGQVVAVRFEHADHDHGGVPWYWLLLYRKQGSVAYGYAPAPYYLSEIERLPVRTP